LTLTAIAAGGEPAPWSDAGRMTVHVIYREHVLDLDYTLDQRQSTTYLTELAEDFFTPSPLVWLPFEVVFSQSKLRHLIDRDAVDDVDRRVFYDILADTLQALDDMHDRLCGAVVTPDILDRARRRFKVFLP
jgi:hypothetical protein